MRVVLIGQDLIIGSRVADAAARASAEFTRVDSPGLLPPAASVDLLLVDWAERDADWGACIAGWRDAASPSPRVLVFGPHTDLEAHAAARVAGIGPMMARSKLLLSMRTLFA